jgi:hypothetical protein
MIRCITVKYSLRFKDLIKFEFSRQIFDKGSNIKFHENPSSYFKVIFTYITWTTARFFSYILAIFKHITEIFIKTSV